MICKDDIIDFFRRNLWLIILGIILFLISLTPWFDNFLRNWDMWKDRILAAIFVILYIIHTFWRAMRKEERRTTVDKFFEGTHQDDN